MISETPRKKLNSRGRPAKQPSCNDFCRVCSVNFKTYMYYEEFNPSQVSMKNLLEEPKRAGNVVLSTCFKNFNLRARKACQSQTEFVQNVPRKSLMLFI